MHTLKALMKSELAQNLQGAITEHMGQLMEHKSLLN